MMRTAVCSIIMMCLCIQPSLAKIYLVSVGIADYPGKVNDLRVSDRDANTIAGVFRNSSSAQVRLLKNSQATTSAVIQSMHSSFDNARADDTVILFFSGHGLPGALMCYNGPLYYKNIYSVLRNCLARRKIVLVDACFSGKIRNSKQHTENDNAQDVLFFLSSRTGELSRETRYQNSLFTLYLDRGLRGGADNNRNKTITAIELYNYVHSGVVKDSQGKQHPVMWGNFDRNMSIIRW